MTIATTTAALYANTNLDAEENRGKREQMINEMIESSEERFKETIKKIYGAPTEEDVYAVDPDDPFFAAMHLPEDVAAEIQKKQE